MSRHRIKPPHKGLGRAAYAAVLPLARRLSSFETCGGAFAKERLASLRTILEHGKSAYLVGMGCGGHNTGVGLIEVSASNGIRLLGNHEEERFQGVKHFQQYPEESVKVLLSQLQELNVDPTQIHAVCASWDYPGWLAKAAQLIVEELPGSIQLLRREASPHMNLSCWLEAQTASRQLGAACFGEGRKMPIIALRHHDNHAWLSWGCSPFAKSEEPVAVLVLDGAGDEGAISAYLAKDGSFQLLNSNDCLWDSLGLMYGMLSSALGGWPLLSSEGRYMGAAAWGDLNRLTNPYYSRLRDILVLENEGQVFLNRDLANWHRGGCSNPFTARLAEIVGPPILPRQMWNPDAVLRVEDIAHAPTTVDRVDKAAAVQLVFEDALFHIVQHVIRTTRCTKLVLTGGTALNCVANTLLLEHFNAEWYERNLGLKNSTLHLWVPPFPADMGASVGAAYHFASLAGARPGNPMKDAFLCGLPPTKAEIQLAVKEDPSIRAKMIGNITRRTDREQVADLMAWMVSRDGVIGIYQGAAETGPRALGHRSILANPTNPKTRQTLNELVKFRELIRPLAPMMTLDAARQWFDLAPGASDDDYNAYSYMVLTARAKAEAYRRIPAVIHKDGTSRVQIVREETDALMHAYLIAMGRHAGVEVSVNTSLNVGAPIAQTPRQAINTLRRSQGMHGLFMVSRDGDVFLAWHHVTLPPKDAGATLMRWLTEWQTQASTDAQRDFAENTAFTPSA